jgi:tetratricopeptide (TPR) repeat protein
MNAPLLCTGRYAIRPFYLEKIGRRIYSIEELCYCIVQNAYMIDTDSFDMDLIDWIEMELGLKKLADELRKMVVHKCSAASFFGMIIDYVGYTTKEDYDKTIEVLRGNADMDIYEKRMARAEFLMKQGHVSQAFDEYETILKNTPDMDVNVKAKIEHNEGVLYAHLFMYDRAGELFLKAYEDGGDEESYMCYLASKRMTMSEREYITFVGENKDARNISLRLEQRMDEANDLYDSSSANIKLRSLELYRTGAKMTEYYEEVERLTQDMKAEYRDLVK